MIVPWDESLGVHPQSEGFTDHQAWDFAGTAPTEYPLLLHYPYFDLYRKQVVKQADLVLALHARGDAFTDEEKARDFAYYEALTVRDSSLSACTQAVIAAEVGHLDLAYDYFGEAALMDIHDLEHNTVDGVHIASLAGAWIAAVAGFGGMRDHDGKLTFAPRLPPRLERLAFRLSVRGSLLKVEVTADQSDLRDPRRATARTRPLRRGRDRRRRRAAHARAATGSSVAGADSASRPGARSPRQGPAPADRSADRARRERNILNGVHCAARCSRAALRGIGRFRLI